MFEEKEKKSPNHSRRRGDELKKAIYKAAVHILENEGYEKEIGRASCRERV